VGDVRRLRLEWCYPDTPGKNARGRLEKPRKYWWARLDSNQEPTPYESISRLERQATGNIGARSLRRQPASDLPFPHFPRVPPVSPIPRSFTLCATLCSLIAPPRASKCELAATGAGILFWRIREKGYLIVAQSCSLVHRCTSYRGLVLTRVFPKGQSWAT